MSCNSNAPSLSLPTHPATKSSLGQQGSLFEVGPSTAKNGAIRYIGAKTRIVGTILDLIGRPSPNYYFIDAFSGTGTVAREAALRGWNVRVNDSLYCATVMSYANCLAVSTTQFTDLGGYQKALIQLNNLPGVKGFIWQEYSPASKMSGSSERRYFTEANAQKIDAIRQRIRAWRNQKLLSLEEEALLISDLILAASKVANIAGTYGCFLSKWQTNALQALMLVPRTLLDKPVKIDAHNKDVFALPHDRNDVAYFDPPYTKRQYAAYYHILETIAHGDAPSVEGVTGLRPWKTKASAFCYKSRALRALVDLTTKTLTQRIFLSYSSEGHVALPDLQEALSKLGELTVHHLGSVGSYRPNRQASARVSNVYEYLLELKK